MTRLLVIAGALAAYCAHGTVAVSYGTFEESMGDGQDVAGWFDLSPTRGDLHQDEAGNTDLPADEDGSYWLNLVDNPNFNYPTGVYQRIGTHEAEASAYRVSFEKGRRGNWAFGTVYLRLYAGEPSASPGDGSHPESLGLRLLSSETVTGPAGADAQTERTALVIDATAARAGESLWLALISSREAKKEVTQALFDDVKVDIPESSMFALYLGALAGMARFGRRRVFRS